MVNLRELKGEMKELLARKEGQTWPVLSTLWAILVPLIIFAHVAHIMRTNFRFHNFYWAMLAGPFIGFIICAIASQKPYKGLRRGKPERTSLVTAICCWFGLGAGLWLGESNFRRYAFAYYSYNDLALYTNIDPARDKGQSYMDAGQVYFKESAIVLTSKAIAYQNAGIYCAAPIVRQPIEVQGTSTASQNVLLPESGTIDFWAVGQDCCDTTGQNFKCGAVGKPFARSGLRMLRDDVRPFYMMAVQEWNAWIGLPSKHPLFFHWVEDPIIEVDSYLEKTHSEYWMHVSGFLFGNAILAFMALYGLKEAGLS